MTSKQTSSKTIAKKKASLPNYRFKVALIGDSFVGKTCIANVFSGNGFSKNYITTIGTDFLTTNRMIDGKKVRLDIWDLSGSERFKSVIHACVRGSHGRIIVYDVNNPESLKASLELYKNLDNGDGSKDCVILVGTKNDLETKVIDGELAEVKRELGVKSFLASSKMNTGLEEIFEYLMKKMIESHKEYIRNPNSIVLMPEENKKNESSCCK